MRFSYPWNLCYYLLLFPFAFVNFVVGLPGGSSKSMSSTSPSSSSSSTSGTIDFLTMARGLKTTPRTGWIRQEAGPRIESVADHSWRITLMAMVATSSSDGDDNNNIKYDTNKCIKMALVHDLAESTVGDITPHCGISDADKHQMELDAMTKMTNKLGPGGKELFDLWKEYEDGTSEEAKLVKDMDKLEMTLQALEYESDGKNGKSLDGFFDSTRNKWRTPIGESWGEEIEARRRQQTVTKDSSSPLPDDSKQEEKE